MTTEISAQPIRSRVVLGDAPKSEVLITFFLISRRTDVCQVLRREVFFFFDFNLNFYLFSRVTFNLSDGTH